MFLAGCRNYKVFKNATEGDFLPAVIAMEVTNNGEDTIQISFNGAEDSIPVIKGTTRVIPVLASYFKASGVVTVVGYTQ